MHAQPRKGSTNSLQYLQQMLGEMRAIAEAERYAMLAYLIEMAYIEVSDIIGGKQPSRVQDEQRDGSPDVPLKATRKVQL